MARVVLITGGSRGIGRATALAFAEQGDHVVINYLTDVTAAQSLLNEILAKGQQASLWQADVANEVQVASMFAGIRHRYHKLDVLVNNAGVLKAYGSILDFDPSWSRTLFNTNVIGLMVCCKEAAKLMKDKGGVIVNVSSVAAKYGSPNEYGDYAASKAAVDALTLGMAQELAPHQIRVNGVRPGLVETDIHAPGRIDRIAPSIPLQRPASPEDIAHAIVWMASEQATYVTGTWLDVAGGR